MRKVILIIVCWLAVVCAGCSPQKRLALLLTTHPELKRDSSWVVGRDIVVPGDSASIDFTIAELRGMASSSERACYDRAFSLDTVFPSSGNTMPDKTIVRVATRTGATATISASEKLDGYRLQVKTPTDTIRLRDTITVPAYTTRVEYKDKIVYQMNNAQSFFFWVGIIMMVLIVVVIVIRIVVRFVKV